METRIQSSRLLTWLAACKMDAGENFTKVLCHTSNLIFDYVSSRLYFSLLVYCNNTQMTSKLVKNKVVKHEPKASALKFCSLDAVTSLSVYYSRTRALLVLYGNLLKDIYL